MKIISAHKTWIAIGLFVCAYTFSFAQNSLQVPPSDTIPTYTNVSDDRVLSGEELRKVCIGNLWSAIVALEPSLLSGMEALYGDMPGMTPSGIVQGTQAWSIEGAAQSFLLLVDGAEVSDYQFSCLNINDVEQVIVYKSPASLSRFGIDGGCGAIGVVLREPEAGKLRINYLFDAQFQSADKAVRRESSYAGLSGHNWLDEPLRMGFAHRHKLDISGGDDYVRYSFSVEGDPSGQGVMKDDYHKTLGLSNYISYRKKAISISNRLSFYQTKNSASPYGTYDYYRTLSPELIPTGNAGMPLTLLPDGSINPLHEVSTGSFNRDKIHTIQDHLRVEVALPYDLSLDGAFTFIRETARNNQYVSPSSGRYDDVEAGTYTGRYDITRDNQLSFESGLGLTYDKTIKSHHIQALGKVSVYSNKVYDETYGGVGISTDRMAHISFTKSYNTEEAAVAHRYYNRNISGGLSASYFYADRYGASAGVSFEKSSLLASESRRAIFYSVGAYWNIHKETFMRDMAFDRLTLSFTRGTSGGVGFDDNAYTVTYDTNVGKEYIYNYYLIGSSIVMMPNNRLRHYTVTRNNVSLAAQYRGVSLSLLGYAHRTTDMSVINPLPLATGYPHTFDNGGELTNRGVELSVGADLLPRDRVWSLYSYMSLAHNRNCITELPLYFANLYNTTLADNYAGVVSDYKTPCFLQEGHSVTELYRRDEAGNLIAIGSTSPKIQGNWGISAAYKQWQMNVVTTYSAGAVAFNPDATSPADTELSSKDNRFTLRTVQISYTFAPWKISRLQLLASGENLARYTSSVYGLGRLYPCARTFTLSLRLQL